MWIKRNPNFRILSSLKPWAKNPSGWSWGGQQNTSSPINQNQLRFENFPHPFTRQHTYLKITKKPRLHLKGRLLTGPHVHLCLNLLRHLLGHPHHVVIIANGAIIIIIITMSSSSHRLYYHWGLCSPPLLMNQACSPSSLSSWYIIIFYLDFRQFCLITCDFETIFWSASLRVRDGGRSRFDVFGWGSGWSGTPGLYFQNFQEYK